MKNKTKMKKRRVLNAMRQREKGKGRWLLEGWKEEAERIMQKKKIETRGREKGGGRREWEG